jgi:hypothetical protein
MRYVILAAVKRNYCFLRKGQTLREAGNATPTVHTSMQVAHGPYDTSQCQCHNCSRGETSANSARCSSSGDAILRMDMTSASGLENPNYGSRDPPCWPYGTLYPQKQALTSVTSGGRSVGIVRSWTQATDFPFISASCWWCAFNLFSVQTEQVLHVRVCSTSTIDTYAHRIILRTWVVSFNVRVLISAT